MRTASPTRPVRRDLADFLAALQSIDAAEGLSEEKQNWFRAVLGTYDKEIQRALEALNGDVMSVVCEIWTTY